MKYFFLAPDECCKAVVLRSNGTLLINHPVVMHREYIIDGVMNGKVLYKYIFPKTKSERFHLCFKKARKNSFFSEKDVWRVNNFQQLKLESH